MIIDEKILINYLESVKEQFEKYPSNKVYINRRGIIYLLNKIINSIIIMNEQYRKEDDMKTTADSILVKGKRKDNGSWAEGLPYPLQSDKKDLDTKNIKAIQSVNGKIYDIIPESIGIFTNTYDSATWEELSEAEREEFVRNGGMPSEWKGRKIFTGDIVQTKNENKEFGRIRGFVGNINGDFVIVGSLFVPFWQLNDHDVEIIGNINDNTRTG